MPNAKILIADAASARRVGENGYLHIDGCPISSFGIFEYGRCQADPDQPDSRDIVNVYRPESEVNNKDIIASFQNVPLIDDHDFLAGADGQGMAPEDKGVDGVLTNVRYDAPWLRGDVIIYSKAMRASIEDGKTELSLGYTCDIKKEAGSFEGTDFEFVQTNMRGNHIALVDEARVKGARILDSASTFMCDSLSFINPAKEPDMKIKAKKAKMLDASSVEKLKALLPALQEFLTEEAEEAAHQEEATGIDEEAQQKPEDLEADADSDVEQKPVVEDEEDVKGLLKALIQKIDDMCADASSEESEEGDAEEAKVDSEEAKKESMDAAIKAVYADQAAKVALYEKLSKVVGAFDASSMDAKAVAAYGVKKLKLTCDSASNAVVLGAYLDGLAKHASAIVAKPTGDSAQSNSDVDAFIASCR